MKIFTAIVALGLMALAVTSDASANPPGRTNVTVINNNGGSGGQVIQARGGFGARSNVTVINNNPGVNVVQAQQVQTVAFVRTATYGASFNSLSFGSYGVGGCGSSASLYGVAPAFAVDPVTGLVVRIR